MTDKFWRRMSAACLIAMWAGLGSLPSTLGELWDDFTRYADDPTDWQHVAKVVIPVFAWAAYRELQRHRDLIRVPDWVRAELEEARRITAQFNAYDDKRGEPK